MAFARRPGAALPGPLFGAFLKGLHADVTPLGRHEVSGDALSESSLPVVEARRATIGAAREPILLADHGPFRPPAFFEVVRSEVLHGLVADDAPPGEALEFTDAPNRLRVHVFKGEESF